MFDCGIEKWGKPREVLTDHGTQFCSDENEEYRFREHLHSLGIKHILSRVKHPQTNGKLERLSRRFPMPNRSHGAELQLPRSERAELELGWTYLSDLIGCTVFDGQREIGEIEDVQFGAGEAPLLVVRNKERGEAQKTGVQLPFEIPFAEAYLEKLDVERKQVRMKLPEGLLEVNAPLAKEEKERSR